MKTIDYILIGLSTIAICPIIYLPIVLLRYLKKRKERVIIIQGDSKFTLLYDNWTPYLNTSLTKKKDIDTISAIRYLGSYNSREKRITLKIESSDLTYYQLQDRYSSYERAMDKIFKLRYSPSLYYRIYQWFYLKFLYSPMENSLKDISPITTPLHDDN